MENNKYSDLLAETIESLQKNIRAMDISNQVNTALRYSYKNTLDDLEEGILSFKNLQEQFDTLNFSIEPAGLALRKSIQESNLQMSKALVSLVPYQNVVKQFQENQKQWANLLNISIKGIPKSVEIASIIKREFTLMESATLMAQQSISRINLQAIGKLVTPLKQTRENLKKSFIEMLDSYNTLWDAFYKNSQKILSIPLLVTKSPSIEIYLATHQVEVSSVDTELPIEEEFICEITPTALNMRRVISSVDKKLIPLYEGAIKAIESDNIDNTRHATVSLRELFTHVLHRLAPDEEFFKWNQDKTNLHNGCPTRKGRLLYIFKNINYLPFTDFINLDISAAISFLDLLQQGTHSIEKPYNDRQLKALFFRMESLIYYMIEISQSV
jgi:hypothetical protein